MMGFFEIWINRNRYNYPYRPIASFGIPLVNCSGLDLSKTAFSLKGGHICRYFGHSLLKKYDTQNNKIWCQIK